MRSAGRRAPQAMSHVTASRPTEASAKVGASAWTARWRALAACTLLACLPAAHAALGEPRYVSFAPDANALAIVQDKHTAPLLADANDWPGVLRAAHDLQADIERVTGIRPPLDPVGRGLRTPPSPSASPNSGATSSPAVPAAKPATAENTSRPTAGSGDPALHPTAIIVGTLGKSALIDTLVRAGKLDVDDVRGHWESWLRQVVDQPLPGVERALVIAGADKRGTIYGLYDLSEQIGVSPWYWWADVVPEHREALFVAASRDVHASPVVKYRGIFLNDEAPDLTNWIRAKFGNARLSTNPPVPAEIANYGREFYARIFEALLRLRANYLWPAMWNNAFNEDDPENARLADEYGVVMGTSHQEPMLRAQKEWDRRHLSSIGTWNYAKHPEVLEAFWREGIRRNQDFESIVTLGLRGANDTEMAPGGPAANRALLEKIVDRQRAILRDELHRDLAEVPQVWCLYKEVQDFYEDGMRVPDDVTLLWAEDNWGNVRRLPTAAERKRAGGAGVYYHFDYHGGPRSYQWLNTSPLPKIWEQMSLAHRYGADRVWIVNVGHWKGYEVPTEFFLNLAWNPNRWTGENTADFLRAWAQREFGASAATAEIADIVARYAKYNGRRKPELLSPHTYSLVNYNEAERVVAEFEDAVQRATRLYRDLPAAKRDAFYELVLFPTLASGLVNELYLAAGRNALFASQGRASANAYAKQVEELFQQYLQLVAHYHHTLADGRWDHFMDQPVLGYTTWRDPPTNNLNHLKLAKVTPGERAALGVAVEGSTSAWPARGSADAPVRSEENSPAAAPRFALFDSINAQRRTFEVFNRGQAAFDVHIAASAPWITVGQYDATVGADQRIEVAIDWEKAPGGRSEGTIAVTGAGESVTIAVSALKTTALTRATLRGFLENAGVVSIEPEHFTRQVGNDAHTRWTRIADYGRTLSGMRADASPEAASPVPPAAPRLEYDLYLFDGGEVEVTVVTSPTLNFVPDRGLRYAVSIDDAAPQVITLVPPGFKAQHGNDEWEKAVADNARLTKSKHTVAGGGYHTLKVWMIDPAVVLQKLLVDRGGLRPSYLGPPESLRGH